MDCLRASEIVSAAHDGELVEAGLLAEARQHCAVCAECRAFVDTIERLDNMPAPRASEELVARIAAIGAATASEVRTAAEHAAAEVAEPPVHERARFGPPPWWGSRFTALASAAAVLLLALTVGGIALLGSPGSRQIAREASVPSIADSSDTLAEAPEGAGADGTSLQSTDQLDAPAYVVFEGGVWVLGVTPTPSVLTTAGVVSSSLAATGGASDHPAYFSGSDTTVLHVRANDGSYRAFDRVVRSLGRADYGLVTDSPITLFGQWPRLPSRFAVPTGSNGAPTFARLGFDDRNVDVYLPVAGRIEEGFAVAPGTAADDPAAGNPNWTWWERL